MKSNGMDGFRAIAYLDDIYTLQSRNGKELKNNFPELEELKSLAKNVVVDGEIVVMKAGKVDFQALGGRGKPLSKKTLQTLKSQSPATYIIFDILEKDGKPLIDLPLMERKTIHPRRPPHHHQRLHPKQWRTVL